MCVHEKANRGCGIVAWMNRIRERLNQSDPPSMSDLRSEDFVMFELLFPGYELSGIEIINLLSNMANPTGSEMGDCMVLLGRRSRCDRESSGPISS